VQDLRDQGRLMRQDRLDAPEVESFVEQLGRELHLSQR